MRTHPFILSLICLLLTVASARAQFKEGGTPGGPELGEAKPQRWKIGISVTASGGACTGIAGYVPVPREWPEQEVRDVEDEVSPSAKISYRTVDNSVRLMVVKIRRLPASQTAKAIVTYEVTHRPQLPPETTDQYVTADTKKMGRDLRRYLGTSPYIESRHPKIRKLAKEIGVDKATAWEQVEAVYDWVRDKVEYKNGPLKGALAALKDGTGDCEEMTSLFIAICRAKDIPARTVWVQGHCYPEFYLEDKEGKGRWFPCQVAGSRAFGGIPETRPILQKGDNFRALDKSRERKHYLNTVVTGDRFGGQPRVREIYQAVGK
ncbi:MAG: transglutaminase domain-containing protein [Pirellulales bacterium]|nr:transglutaminase domain-containing protein [Pirellulales bacterium]